MNDNIQIWEAYLAPTQVYIGYYDFGGPVVDIFVESLPKEYEASTVLESAEKLIKHHIDWLVQNELQASAAPEDWPDLEPEVRNDIEHQVEIIPTISAHDAVAIGVEENNVIVIWGPDSDVYYIAARVAKDTHGEDNIPEEQMEALNSWLWDNDDGNNE